MSDESQLQVRPKDGDSSLSLSRVSLIARGRRDAAILTEPPPLKPGDPLSETRRLAEEGDADAQYDLGAEYYDSSDYAEAAKWWRRAAEQGHAQAENALGALYSYGEGVTRDFAEAARWFRKAAERGHAVAQCYVSSRYYDGDEVPQDYVQAYMWIDLAASGSTGDDQKTYSSRRGAIAAKMTAQQIAEAQRLARERRLELGR